MIRFLIPNAITCMSIAMAGVAIGSAVVGDFRSAAWWILYCTITDKLDGIAARALKATSAFGVQIDSLADLVSFGVAPATVVFSFVRAHPELGWSTGWRAMALPAFALGYLICAAVRLARFNVTTETPGMSRLFFGVPSTFSGGWVAAVLATVIKYGEPTWGGAAAGDWRMLGGVRLDAVAAALPWILAACGFLMVSNLRVPKIGKTPWLATTVLVLGNLLFCYGVGLTRRLPEYLTACGIAYFLISIGYHFSPTARSVQRPRLLPKRDAAA
jgi:CDP-diacylglycerol--serine O-phosphatidyltransferase